MNIEPQLLRELVQKDYVLYAPKSKRGLKMEYPDLNDYEDFAQLNEPEMLFVWSWACTSSPFREMPLDNNLRLKACLEYAYPDELARKTKFSDYSGRGLPDHIQRAVIQMGNFNLAARVEEMTYLMQLRANCKHEIAQDIRDMKDEQKDQYWVNAAKARKELVETRHVVERGAMGLAEEKDTHVHIMKNLIGLYHKNTR
jgi:hypothetical protein